MRKASFFLIISFISMMFISGCATLDVSPRVTLESNSEKKPAKIGIITNAERIRSVLVAGDNPLITVLQKEYKKAVLLSPDSRFSKPAQLSKENDLDYILTLGVSDFSVNGNLNPIWFASIPLLFFKPYAPIVTFEAAVTIDAILTDASGDKILYKKDVTEVVTDHFSPKDPQEKVQELIGRGVNNAVVSVARDLRSEMRKLKQ